MKPARASDSGILTHDGSPYGILLAADYTSEHEWGVDELKRRVGIAAGRQTFANMKMTRSPYTPLAHAKFTKTEKFYLGVSKPTTVKTKGTLLTTEEVSNYTKDLCRRYSPEDPIGAAFDQRHFAVAAYTPEAITALELLVEGFANQDIALWMASSDNPFGRGGLLIVRHSMVPASYVASFDAAYHDHVRLEEAAAATGIAERLRSGIQTRYREPFMALSPRWMPEKRAQDSAHPVIFWLNPFEQSITNSGWFTVEELDQWIEGKGPVPKVPQKRTA